MMGSNSETAALEDLVAGIERGAELAYTVMVRKTHPNEPWQEIWDWQAQSEKLRQDWRAVVMALMGMGAHDRPHRFRGEPLLDDVSELQK